MRRSWLVALMLLAAGIAVAAWLLRPHVATDVPEARLEPTRLFEQVLSHVRRFGVDSISEPDLYRRAASGLLTSLEDEYATLLQPGHTAGLAETPDVGGLGLLLAARDGRITVLGVLPGSSAAQAGVLAGDVLLEAGGAPLDATRRDQVLAALSGPPDSRVSIRLRRPGIALLSVELTRASPRQHVVQPALQWDDRIGYVGVRLLGPGAVRELREQVDRLLREGISGLVLDLRGASQGDRDEGVALADLFLEPGAPVLEVRRRQPETERIGDDAPQDRRLARLPVVVLVDSTTADAAEVAAGALQDNDRALLLGAPTFGRGLSAETFPLTERIIVRISTGRWFTPAGRSIQRDTATSDTLSLRPRVNTTGGRTVYGGGGIVPDSVLVPPADAAEQLLAQSLGTDQPRWRALVRTVAAEFAGSARQGDAAVPSDGLSRLRVAARDSGLALGQEVWSGAGPVIERQLGDQIAAIRRGDSALAARRIRRDPLVAKAAELLRKAPTPTALVLNREP